MCTSMTFKTKDNYFGRTLDLEYSFNEKVVITPKNYEFKLKEYNDFKTKYAFIGTATIVDGYPLYAEATNEKGLSIAGLNFPENAFYHKRRNDMINLASYELIPWILGNFSSVEEVGYFFFYFYITNESFSEDLPSSPLHWMLCDKNHCLVLEPMQQGLEIHFNPVGILTNNPPITYHLTNINNYINLTPDICNNRFSTKIKLDTYSLGMGAIGLPGDNSSTSRFIRSAFNKLNSVSDLDEDSSVSQFFHILDTVTIVKGTTMTKDKKWNATTYSCCINIDKGIYYYKTYNNNQITAIKLNSFNINNNQLTIYDLENTQQIKYLN